MKEGRHAGHGTYNGLFFSPINPSADLRKGQNRAMQMGLTNACHAEACSVGLCREMANKRLKPQRKLVRRGQSQTVSVLGNGAQKRTLRVSIAY